jgi:hypothetical protein
VGPDTAVVGKVVAQQATQVGLVKHHHVVETLAAQGPDEAFHVRILPRGPRRGLHFADPQGLDSAGEHDPVEDRIAVAQEISRGGVPGERLHDLLGRPRGRWGIGHVTMDHASPMVRQDDEDEQDLERHRGHGEEVHGGHQQSHPVPGQSPEARSPRITPDIPSSHPGAPGSTEATFAGLEALGRDIMTDVTQYTRTQPWPALADGRWARLVLRARHRSERAAIARRFLERGRRPVAPAHPVCTSATGLASSDST